MAPYLKVIRPELSFGGLVQVMGRSGSLAQGMTDWYNWMVYSLVDDRDGLGVPVTVEILYQQMRYDLSNKYSVERKRFHEHAEVREAEKLFRYGNGGSREVRNPLGIPISDELRLLMGATPETVALVEMGQLMEQRLAVLRGHILDRRGQIERALVLPDLLQKRSTGHRSLLSGLVLFDTYVRDRVITRGDRWGEEVTYDQTRQTNNRGHNMLTAAKLLDELVDWGSEIPRAWSTKEAVLRGDHSVVIEKADWERQFADLRRAFELFVVSAPLRILEIAQRGDVESFEEVVQRIRDEIAMMTAKEQFIMELSVKGT